jgi:hypothetical protein
MRPALNVVLAGALSLLLACADGLAPEPPAGDRPSFQLGTSVQSRHEQLKALLALEKERIKQQRDAGKLGFEVARAEWKIYKRELKQAKKLGSKPVDLLRCEPKPFEGDAAIIGPEGGTLHIGPHTLVIPHGALSEEQLIVGEAPTSSLVDVDFEPEGLHFERPAQLTLSYKGCDVPAGLDLQLVYLGSGNRILELPPSEDHPEESEVSGEIQHFSRYAVAY